MPFCPQVFLASDPNLLPGVAGTLSPNAEHIGTLWFELLMEDAAGNARIINSLFGAVGTGLHVPAKPQWTLGHILLEPCLDTAEVKLSSIALYNAENEAQAGCLIVMICARTPPPPTKLPLIIALSAGGLVSLSGLDNLTEDSEAVLQSESASQCHCCRPQKPDPR